MPGFSSYSGEKESPRNEKKKGYHVTRVSAPRLKLPQIAPEREEPKFAALSVTVLHVGGGLSESLRRERAKVRARIYVLSSKTWRYTSAAAYTP